MPTNAAADAAKGKMEQVQGTPTFRAGKNRNFHENAVSILDLVGAKKQTDQAVGYLRPYLSSLPAA